MLLPLNKQKKCFHHHHYPFNNVKKFPSPFAIHEMFFSQQLGVSCHYLGLSPFCYFFVSFILPSGFTVSQFHGSFISSV